MGLMQTAQMLHEKGWLPEVVMSSNSERTRQTLEAMREAVDAFRYRLSFQQSQRELPGGQHPHKHLCCYAAVDPIWGYAEGALLHTLQRRLAAVCSCMQNKLLCLSCKACCAVPFLLGLLWYVLKAHAFSNKLQLLSCRHAETHFRGSLYTIAALDGMTRKHLQNVIVDACRQSMHDCVLCLGHNKGWEEAATSFAVSHATNDMTRQVQNPCAMLSQSILDCDW